MIWFVGLLYFVDLISWFVVLGFVLVLGLVCARVVLFVGCVGFGQGMLATVRLIAWVLSNCDLIVLLF